MDALRTHGRRVRHGQSLHAQERARLLHKGHGRVRGVRPHKLSVRVEGRAPQGSLTLLAGADRPLCVRDRDKLHGQGDGPLSSQLGGLAAASKARNVALRHAPADRLSANSGCRSYPPARSRLSANSGCRSYPPTRFRLSANSGPSTLSAKSGRLSLCGLPKRNLRDLGLELG